MLNGAANMAAPLTSGNDIDRGFQVSDIQLSTLVKVPLRKVWKHETLNFTQWLAKPENIETLGEVLGIDLIDPKAEVGIGQFQYGCWATLATSSGDMMQCSAV